MNKIPETCGCGQPIRYIIPGNDPQTGSCNKYARCPTYEELRQLVKDRTKLILALKAEIDKLLSVIKPDTAKIQELLKQIESISTTALP